MYHLDFEDWHHNAIDERASVARNRNASTHRPPHKNAFRGFSASVERPRMITARGRGGFERNVPRWGGLLPRPFGAPTSSFRGNSGERGGRGQQHSRGGGNGNRGRGNGRGRGSERGRFTTANRETSHIFDAVRNYGGADHVGHNSGKNFQQLNNNNNF